MIASHDIDECQPCRTAQLYGFWADSIPKGWTHCRDCHKSWPGYQVWEHCQACHYTFRGVTTFDSHQSAGKCPPDALHGWSSRGKTYAIFHDERGFHYFGRSDPVEFPTERVVGVPI